MLTALCSLGLLALVALHPRTPFTTFAPPMLIPREAVRATYPDVHPCRVPVTEGRDAGGHTTDHAGEKT
jgi:hypothetical protein